MTTAPKPSSHCRHCGDVLGVRDGYLVTAERGVVCYESTDGGHHPTPTPRSAR